ncbi:zinc transport system substrate-binding protein [Tamilnaduibacter salinus]|uniref:High-affinity zinc uptake system protein ZnuA n=1 Tax=Tamilnaduibacter salinus TaxID=1484056 RepID=A0A2A2I8R3_9GAMM|nr:zinc ABC transporter substrate-binding protein [Tamilnaduibacter salinus]PAV27453.1 ABC transporter substrate-binding protein [Tamilnaduibacter salinus]PVY75434.1 zinc transport system substrate-binding protein [Tamilnaduibacter salinus]
MPRLLAFVLMLTLAMAAHAEPLRIVTSIKPITLIAAEIAPADARFHTLVPASASPHTYQLKPSDRVALARADVILWVGPALETFLQRLLEGPDMAGRAHALGHRLENGQPNSPDDDEHHHDHGHHHGGDDPHIWVSPDEGHHLAEQIAHILSHKAPDRSDVIQHRLHAFEDRLSATNHAIEQQLSPIRSHVFFIYHPAFKRFAKHFGLEVAGTLTRSPEQQPGARHLSGLQEQLKTAERPCLLNEVQFSDRHWQSLTTGALPHATWDPLATTISVGDGGYTRFLSSIADSVMTCQQP